MAYSDRRRNTLAALQERPREQRIVWLRPNDEGQPEVTRRVTGLRRYRLLRVTDVFANHRWRDNDGPYNTGLKRWSVQDVETGLEYQLPAMGNGTTVWTVDPVRQKKDELP